MKTFKDYVIEGDVVQGPWKSKEHTSKMSDDNHFNKFVKDNVKRHDDHSVTATDAYESYCGHAEKHNHQPMDLPSFSKKMSEHGIYKQKIAGRVRHIGIKVHSYGDND